jgi:hypothetical protein
MNFSFWLFIIVLVLLLFAPSIVELIGRLLAIGSNRSPQHMRRAEKRVAIWGAIVILFCTYLFWNLFEAPRTPSQIFGLIALNLISLFFLYGAFKHDKKNQKT